MLNENRRYDTKDFNRSQRSNPEREQARLRALRRTFAALVSGSVTLFAIIVGILFFRTPVGESISLPIGSVNTPTPTVPYTVPEILPDSPVSDAYWGELVPAEEAVPYTHNEVRGLYLGAAAYLEENIEIAKNSEINAFVIDLKESNGVLFNTTNETANRIGYVWSAYDLDEVVRRCHEEGILVIGRIVCFKDPQIASVFPERAICDEEGNPLYFTNEGNKSFADPYNTENWDYVISLAEEAIARGVDEIQFDYVRFPTGNTTTGMEPYYGEGQIPSKAEAINRFLQTARIRIQDTLGVPISADIFGIVVTSSLDGQIIGQDWSTVGLTQVDSLCPMIYPSHYALGTMMNRITFEKPDLDPYGIMYNALLIGSEYSSAEGYSVVRPYLQAFTAAYIGAGNYMEYDYEAINDQIRGLQDAGFSEFILWNAGAVYPEGNYGGNND